MQDGNIMGGDGLHLKPMVDQRQRTIRTNAGDWTDAACDDQLSAQLSASYFSDRAMYTPRGMDAPAGILSSPSRTATPPNSRCPFRS